MNYPDLEDNWNYNAGGGHRLDGEEVEDQEDRDEDDEDDEEMQVPRVIYKYIDREIDI